MREKAIKNVSLFICLFRTVAGFMQKPQVFHFVLPSRRLSYAKLVQGESRTNSLHDMIHCQLNIILHPKMSPTQTARRPWKSTFWSRWTNSLPLPYTSVPRAHIYIRKLFPKKAFTRSQEVRFTMVFIRKRCEGFHFQPFTRFTGHGVARGRVWRLGRQCEGLKSPTLHNGKQWKSAGNEQSVNGWTVFSGINYVYTHAWRKETMKLSRTQ